MLPAALMLLFTATQQQQLVGWVVKRDPSCIGHVWEAELAFLAGQVAGRHQSARPAGHSLSAVFSLPILKAAPAHAPAC